MFSIVYVTMYSTPKANYSHVTPSRLGSDRSETNYYLAYRV